MDKMPFAFPSLDEILYRAWRLRRLIAFCSAIPFVIFALLGLVGLNGLAGSVGGLIALAIVHTALIAAHAILFPNAAEETFALSITLSVFALIMAIIPNALIGLLLCVIFAGWALIWGQAKVPDIQSNTDLHDPETIAKVKVSAKPEAARSWFPLRPESERGQIKCGSVDRSGAFPVWFDLAAVSVDVFSGLAPAEADVMDRVKSKLDQAPVEKETSRHLAEQFQATQDEPSFWARVEIDEPDFQRTRLFFRDPSGKEEESSVVEHRFKKAKNGVVVTEIDTTLNYPKGLSLGMWLTDFQLDGLIHSRELLENSQALSLRAAHRWSLLTLAGRWFSMWQMGREGAA
jgi:hypothetical protein